MLNVRKITANIGSSAKGIASKVATPVKAAAKNVVTGAAKGTGVPVKSYDEAVLNSLGWFGKNLSKLKVDEKLNIIVTAVGTAIVAPIFIAFNPLSKKDKESKMYSALRQPISAVIAVAAQLGVVNLTNHALDKYASTGVVNAMDLRDKPAESYLQKLIKMKNPNIKKGDLAAEIAKRQESAFKKAIACETENFKNVETKNILDILTKENSISVKDHTNKLEELAKAKKAEGAKESLRVLKKQLKDGVEDAVLADTKNVIKENAEKLVRDGKCANFDDALRQETIKKFVSAKIAKASDMLNCNKNYIGIALGLATLPVTCGILNWAYPRIVEKFFPSLANSKKESEAKKAEAEAQPSVQKTNKEAC